MLRVGLFDTNKAVTLRSVIACFSYESREDLTGGMNIPTETCQWTTGTCNPRLVRKDDPTKDCEENGTRVTSKRRIRVKLLSMRRKNATLVSVE
jgi:hypothetical protein